MAQIEFDSFRVHPVAYVKTTGWVLDTITNYAFASKEGYEVVAYSTLAEAASEVEDPNEPIRIIVDEIDKLKAKDFSENEDFDIIFHKD